MGMVRMLLAFMALCAASSILAADGDAARGRKVYTKVGCWQCHGKEAQGGGYVGPRLAPDPMPYNVLEAYIRHPTGDMPPYSKKVLSDADIRDIYAFLRSIPKPPPASKIQTLNQ